MLCMLKQGARILDLQNFLSKANPVASVYHLQELLSNKFGKLYKL